MIDRKYDWYQALFKLSLFLESIAVHLRDHSQRKKMECMAMGADNAW
jgi:hypothetical protein